ncbi:MAG TPA: hypothetical protein VJ852_14265 [Gemmatimonadaceae bacterium]|nr:hypothetical protein [Gemmatimonadaceae bacterium]
MNPTSRALSCALMLAPIAAMNAQAPNKNLAIDFRTTVTVQGTPDTGVILGHAVGSADKVRMDLKMQGSGAQPSPLSNDGSMSMILSDSGKTVTYLDTKGSHYIKMRPADMFAQTQQMGVKMDFSNTKATVDSLGPGPAILGHPTKHYRIGTGMTMTINAMGQQQTVTIASTSDYYYASDIKGAVNPFASLSGADMASAFSGSSKEFAEKMRAAQAKLPKATPLKASSSATMTVAGMPPRVTTTDAIVTAIKWVDADPKAFEVPASYTPLELPGLNGPPAGATPPQE